MHGATMRFTEETVRSCTIPMQLVDTSFALQQFLVKHQIPTDPQPRCFADHTRCDLKLFSPSFKFVLISHCFAPVEEIKLNTIVSQTSLIVCGQSLCLLIMRSWVRFPVLPWEFSLKGRIPAVTMVWVG